MSILNQDDSSNSMTEDAAEAALMASFDPKGKTPEDDDGNPSDDDGDEIDDTEEDEGDDGDESDADEDANDDDGSDEEASAAAPALNDDTKVKVTVNGEEQEVSIGSLKRLAGQEASLTRKSQEADAVGGRAAATLKAALDIIQEDYAPYANVDWLVAQTQMDPAEFAWHRENAAALEGKFQKLVGAAEGFEHTIATRRKAADAEAVTALHDAMKAEDKDWSDTSYQAVLTYAAKEGLDADDLKAVTNPTVMKLLRKAMLHDSAKAVATKKLQAAPTKTVRAGQRGQMPVVNKQKLERRLANSGSSDDAVAVLMGRWG